MVKKVFSFIFIMILSIGTSLALADDSSAITLPDSLTEISDNLTQVNIPSNVEKIGERAFMGCSSLTDVILPDGLITIGMDAFAGCVNLRSINIPENVNTIDDRAFMTCKSLATITIPEGVTTIGEDVFDECNILVIVSEGSYAHYWCIENQVPYEFCAEDILKNFLYGTVRTSSGNSYIEIRKYIGSSSVVIVPSIIENKEVRYICENAFEECNEVTEIILPETLTSISGFAFHNCSALQKITIPSSVTWIGGYAFQGCYPTFYCEIGTNAATELSNFMSSYQNYSGVTFVDPDYPEWEIRQNGYSQDEYSLRFEAYIGDEEYVEIPNNLDGIPTYAVEKSTGGYVFGDNDTVRKIVIADGITNLGVNLCYDCDNLEELVIGSGITDLYSIILYECWGLKSIIIPESVTWIEERAFANCSAFTIYGVEGSCAHDYAVEAGYTFQPIS